MGLAAKYNEKSQQVSWMPWSAFWFPQIENPVKSICAGFGILENAAGTENVSSIGANGVSNQGTMWWQNGALSFDGVKLFVANGLGDNKAVAAEKSNLFFGTGLLSDHNEVKLIDMADLDGSQNVRVVMRFTAGVQYGIGSDIVLYS